MLPAQLLAKEEETPDRQIEFEQHEFAAAVSAVNRELANNPKAFEIAPNSNNGHNNLMEQVMDLSHYNNKSNIDGFDQLMTQLFERTSSANDVMNANGELENGEELMEQMKSNSYFGALRSVLRDEKQKICQITNSLANALKLLMAQCQQQDGDIQNDNQFEGANNSSASAVQQKMTEYQAFCENAEKDSEEVEGVKAKMKDCFLEYWRIEKLIEQHMDYCLEYSRHLLSEHGQLRPITRSDIEQFESGIRLSAELWRNEMRDAVCSNLLLLKALGTSQRKKRQNFSPQTIAILNKYFMQNLNQPYPDEAAKVTLAEKCGITLAQVSNWFGNKRIRFRKAKLKAPRSTEDEEGQNETSEGEELPPSTKTTQMDMNVKKETL